MQVFRILFIIKEAQSGHPEHPDGFLSEPISLCERAS